MTDMTDNGRALLAMHVRDSDEYREPRGMHGVGAARTFNRIWRRHIDGRLAALTLTVSRRSRDRPQGGL